MTDRLAEIKADLKEERRMFSGDLYWLIAEVERLNIVLGESIGKNGQAVVRQCVYCNREFTRFSCESRMACQVCDKDAMADDAERWRYVREHGPWCLTYSSKPNQINAIYYDAADAAVDAARKP